MKRHPSLFLFLLGVLFLPAEGLGRIALQTDSGNVASRHLAGEWRLLPELSQRLTGDGGGAPDLVSITSDPSVLDSLPPQVEESVKSGPVYMAGTLTFVKARYAFLLTEQGGSQRLVCFQPGNPASHSGVLSILFELVPAREPQNDLLFLGGERDGQPFFAYERLASESASRLSAETRDLLLDALNHSYSSSLDKLPRQPDWQAAVDLLIEQMRTDPNGQHNNRCIVLAEMVSRHLGEIRFDLEPLLAVLKSRSWTNQQKAADVLAKAERRPELFAGREQAIIQSLIPLIASQRGPVVEPALQILHALGGPKTLKRDVLGWARWYQGRFGEKLELAGSVFELVDVVDVERKPGVAATFRADGKRLDAEELRRHFQDFISRARMMGLRPAFVALVPVPVTSPETQDRALRDAQPIRDVLGSLGVEEITLTPRRTVFYPPFAPGFPAGSGKP